MKKLILMFTAFILVIGCQEGGPEIVPATKYSGDLAVKWFQLEMQICRTTTGFGPGPATRSFAYSGLVLYESIAKGMPGYRSVATSMMETDVTSNLKFPVLYWPASANAAMAETLRSFIPAANEANKLKIDSLESAFNSEFALKTPANVFDNSVEYGKTIAKNIFTWSKSDGFAEAIAKNGSYAVPAGSGVWEPTPPALAAPINVYVSEIRTFVPKVVSLTMPPPPMTYSEAVGSPFHTMVKEVYDISKALTATDVLTVKTWGEFPGNYTNALRYIQISIQLVDESDITLDRAALTFALHGMALQDAVASVFGAKYKYNQLRPITYIRNVMGFSTWNTVNTTPPHPEYPAAHATVGRASSRILESIFGENYSFIDHTHENLYGARTYNNLKEYSTEAGASRVLGGIHYKPSVQTGLEQGEKVANLILQLPFRR